MIFAWYAPYVRRVLLTEDKDFGWLVYVSQSVSRGVVLVRCSEGDRGTLAGKLVGLILSRASELQESFVVVTPEKARLSKLPKLPKLPKLDG